MYVRLPERVVQHNLEEGAFSFFFARCLLESPAYPLASLAQVTAEHRC
jgi:hypothetical protein